MLYLLKIENLCKFLIHHAKMCKIYLYLLYMVCSSFKFNIEIKMLKINEVYFSKDTAIFSC